MAGPLRIEFSGAIYHVTCRMIGDWHTNRARLFKDDTDYWRFLDSLGERVETFHVRLYLFTCMIGGAAFRDWVDEYYQARLASSGRAEDVSFRRVLNPLSVEEILAVMSEVLHVAPAAFRQRRRNSPLRALAARMLTHYGGRTQRDAASQLGMKTGGAVSAQLRSLPGLLEQDRALKRRMTRIETMLTARKKDPIIEQ